MRWRYLPFYLFLIGSFWLIIFRLVDLTLIKGGDYRQLAQGNRIQEKLIRAPRGIIYDRHGQVLVRNKPVYRYQVSSSKYKQSFSSNEVVSREQALEIEARGGSEMAKLQLDLVREYPWGGILAHALGYMGEISDEEIRNPKSEIINHKMGDWIGRTGVEEKYEETLRGIDGRELVETDALGRKVKTLGRLEAQPGQNLTLSLDLDLQKVAAQEMSEKVGAIVVSNPQTGEILALYSSPSFDPNHLSEKTLTDPIKSLFDRAISGLYPPGSTFKIITASAGLETGKIDKSTRIEDTGEIIIGPYRYPNWYWTQYGRKEGVLDIVSALKRSNDIFFYKVGEFIGVSQLAAWADRFGLGKILGIDLPGEAAGLVPTPEWRKKVLAEDWFLGDTYHLAIGQGNLQVTPLQVNFWTNVIANAGKLCQPRVTKISDLSNLCKEIGLKKETIDLIKEGMKQACQEGGTGWPLFNFKAPSSNKEIQTACKTGTAEYGDPKGKTHAWFTVFAPADSPAGEPEITVTVLVEGGGEGSNVAAPIAKKILEEWFSR